MPYTEISELALSMLLKLVAVRTENNQNLVEELLSQVDTRLVITPSNFHDLSGRYFNLVTAYEYAFWAGDIRMLDLFNKYILKTNQALLYKKCLRIQQKGLRYTLKNKTYYSKPLGYYMRILASYESYINAAKNNQPITFFSIDFILYLREQATTCLLQEYCAPRAFYTIKNAKGELIEEGATFQEQHLPRTAQLFYLNKNDPWAKTLDNHIVLSPYLSLTNPGTTRMCLEQIPEVNAEFIAALTADFDALKRLAQTRHLQLNQLLTRLTPSLVSEATIQSHCP